MTENKATQAGAGARAGFNMSLDYLVDDIDVDR
jgi:hypothetical protein